MDCVELVEFLIKSLVKNPESVSIKQFDSENDEIDIHVLVDKDEIGAVIGRGGAVANAIRTVVQAASYNSANKRVRINIDSF